MLIQSDAKLHVDMGNKKSNQRLYFDYIIICCSASQVKQFWWHIYFTDLHRVAEVIHRLSAGFQLSM